MSDDETRQMPPEFGDDDGKHDDAMFVSAMPPTVDVSLSGGEEEEEENPFGQPTPARKKTPTTTTVTVEPNYENKKSVFEEENIQVKVDDDDEDLFGETKTKTNDPPPLFVPPVTPVAIPEPTTPKPIMQDLNLFPTDLNAASAPVAQPVRSSNLFESQMSSSTIPKSVTSDLPASKPPLQRKRSTEHNIEISVSDPTKVGDGMSSYMIYRISTKTSLPMFKKTEFSVNRRFSDFLGLHGKLISKHLHVGIIVPSPPEKDTLSMAKVKISKDETIPTDFIDRRRAQLERYLNRLARHETLVQDPDFREFIELPNELPKSTQTQALSGAGVLRALTNISNQMTKLTTKLSEQDQWFEEKHTFIVDLHAHLKQLHNNFHTLYIQRKEAGQAAKQLEACLNHLATIEEHTLLSSALMGLANVEDKLEHINSEHAQREYSIITELLKEYVTLLEMVQAAFQERIKVHQNWLHAEDTLKKKRETKIKLEQTPKGADKLPQAEMDINEWEGRVVKTKEEFEHISETIKQEIDVFEQTRVEDFKKAIDIYLKRLLEQQEKILEIWEGYLPEANKITA